MKIRTALAKRAGRPVSDNAGRAARSTCYKLEDQVGFLLRRVNQRHLALFAEGFAATGLTPTQFAALVKLNDEGALSQNRLGRLTAMDPATILGVIQRLEARELVHRQADAHDGRLTILRLTEAGTALVQRSLKRGLQVSARTLEPLTPHEQKTLLALLEKLT